MPKNTNKKEKVTKKSHKPLFMKEIFPEGKKTFFKKQRKRRELLFGKQKAKELFK